MADEILDGSCLCGAVRYRVRGPFMRFVHCHCSRCRKATGSAHATNLIAEAGNLEWIAGRDNMQRFDLPTAKSFATTVCRTCGSPVPRLSRDGQRSVIPAGSLDSAPGIQPTARIYWDSRTPWSCEEDELHRFPEGPA